MKLKDIKPLITGEYITLFEVFPAFNVLREEHLQIYPPAKPTKFDDYELTDISRKSDCELYIYVKHKEE